jgi:hypothetical protein
MKRREFLRGAVAAIGAVAARIERSAAERKVRVSEVGGMFR